jgi:hypothetical protein
MPQPDLSNRKAKCNCGKIENSDANMAFFKYKIDEQYDQFYCGCSGWD